MNRLVMTFAALLGLLGLRAAEIITTKHLIGNFLFNVDFIPNYL